MGQKDEGEKKSYAGRKPSLKLDDDTISRIHGLASIQCTQGEAAAVLGVHLNTFKNFLKKKEKAREAWDDGLENGRASLRRTQFALAQKSAAMAIFLGKNMLGQKDRQLHEHGGEDGQPIPIKIESLTNEQLTKLIDRIETAISSRGSED